MRPQAIFQPIAGSSDASGIGASGDYTGLGTNKKTTYFVNNGSGLHSSDFYNNAHGNCYTGDGGYFFVGEWSHEPQCMFYTLLTEGGAHLMDAMLVMTNQALLTVDNSAGANWIRLIWATIPTNVLR